jgi:hypothetical protein
MAMIGAGLIVGAVVLVAALFHRFRGRQ